MLYSFQTSLPKLPVPSVPATIHRVRAWVRPPSGQGRLDSEGLSEHKERVGLGGSNGAGAGRRRGQRQLLLTGLRTDNDLVG